VLDPLKGHLNITGIDLNADVVAKVLLADDPHSAGAEEWVKYPVSWFRAGHDAWLDETRRKGGEMFPREGLGRDGPDGAPIPSVRLAY